MIIFPMAGYSSRFTAEGYTLPKYMLSLWEGKVFDYAVCSFASAFHSETFLFIYRETGAVRTFLEARINFLGIKNAICVELKEPTAGQAETVELGLRSTNVNEDSPITIFNIDTLRMPWASDLHSRNTADGIIEVFQGDGSNWSFVRPAEDEKCLVAETTEKVAISKLCSNGLYFFGSQRLFSEALEAERQSPSSTELYIAPMYNHLIRKGHRVVYQMINSDELDFCGIPSEYRSLNESAPPYSMDSLLKSS